MPRNYKKYCYIYTFFSLKLSKTEEWQGQCHQSLGKLSHGESVYSNHDNHMYDSNKAGR